MAAHGWKLLPDYHFNPATGLWHHHDGPVEPPLRLSQLSYDPITGELQRPAGLHPGALAAEFEHLRWFDLPEESLAR